MTFKAPCRRVLLALPFFLLSECSRSCTHHQHTKLSPPAPPTGQDGPHVKAFQPHLEPCSRAAHVRLDASPFATSSRHEVQKLHDDWMKTSHDDSLPGVKRSSFIDLIHFLPGLLRATSEVMFLFFLCQINLQLIYFFLV